MNTHRGVTGRGGVCPSQTCHSEGRCVTLTDVSPEWRCEPLTEVSPEGRCVNTHRGVTLRPTFA